MDRGRHEPLPDLSGLPRWAWRRSSRAVKIGAGLAVLAGIALGLALAPGIRESKEERAREERRVEAAERAARVRRLRAQQRPVTGRLPPGGIEAAVLADARRRGLRLPVTWVDCEPLPPRPDRFDCLAVTASIPPTESNKAGQIGYPYRARVDPAARRFALCKISGRPGEGAIATSPFVPVPAACGGR